MSRRTLAIVLCMLAPVGLAGWWFTAGSITAHAADPAPVAEVPVGTETTAHEDVPVFLDGLGTVQAFNVVQIKAQVNATLIALPAHEGQEVHAGDIIAQIDPRPWGCIKSTSATLSK